MKPFRRIASRLADVTVAPAFGSAGYKLRRGLWADPDIKVDLSGRNALVTGANSGLGFEITKALAARGASVRMLCRSPERGERALERIKGELPRAKLALDILDMSSLEDIRRYCGGLEVDGVHILVHNAGALLDDRVVTAEGHEVTFATHVLGPFLMTDLLEEQLARAHGRVVVVTSGGMYLQHLDLEVLQGEVERFDGVVAYAQAKRAQVILNGYWHERLRSKGVAHNCMHPGWADTPGVRTSLPRFRRLLKPMLRTPSEGADTAVWLAASDEAEGRSGELWLDREPQDEHKLPSTKESESERRALLELCCAASGVHWPS